MESKPAADSEGIRLRHKAADADAAKGKVHAQVAAAQVVDILSVLLFFRFINALCVRTFFQPDEYFQALEPAWRIAFGSDSGAWLTWVHHLPSCRVSRCPSFTDNGRIRNGNTSSDRLFIRPSLGWHTRRSTVP